ncbi:putative exportin-T [Apostichopus japonicus]|uniref:Exportin-T n=1 Tax=Stichopus japonicus TaxID=307972 RepID=A0A2G8KAN3_STIJA|nr:putative exportin-T [Apostichopus japonicus]
MERTRVTKSLLQHLKEALGSLGRKEWNSCVQRLYIMNIFIPACFMAPLKRNFDLTDAQTVLALTEMSSVLNLLFTKEGADFIQFLQSKYFPSISLQADTSQVKSQFITEVLDSIDLFTGQRIVGNDYS